jgi:hypothetical protein
MRAWHPPHRWCCVWHEWGGVWVKKDGHSNIQLGHLRLHINQLEGSREQHAADDKEKHREETLEGDIQRDHHLLLLYRLVQRKVWSCRGEEFSPRSPHNTAQHSTPQHNIRS